MGQQKGALKLKGTLGDITFAKTKDGFIFKEKSEITKQMRATHKSFAAFRDNQVEFARAGKAVKLIRKAFNAQLDFGKDRRLTPRLQQLMMRVVKADATNDRGKRTVLTGDTDQLKGFEFNDPGHLQSSFTGEFAADIDRATGVMSVIIPPFVSANRTVKPLGATHFRLFAAGAELDFENDTSLTVASETPLLPIDGIETALITLSQTLPAQSTKSLLLVFGICFLEVVNGFVHELSNQDNNALSLVALDM